MLSCFWCFLQYNVEQGNDIMGNIQTSSFCTFLYSLVKQVLFPRADIILSFNSFISSLNSDLILRNNSMTVKVHQQKDRVRFEANNNYNDNTKIRTW